MSVKKITQKANQPLSRKILPNFYVLLSICQQKETF